MATLTFINGHGEASELTVSTDETLFQGLIRHHIPPESVIVLAQRDPVSLFEVPKDGTRYEAIQLEQYDIEMITDMYSPTANSAFTYRRTDLTESGLSEVRRDCSDPADIEGLVEERLGEVIRDYDLLTEGDSILVGYSGGIDSTGLLLALNHGAALPPETTVTVTRIEEYWPRSSETAPPAALLDREALEELCSQVSTIETAQIDGTYGLSRPIDEVFAELIERESDPIAVSTSLNRRMLEAEAEAHGTDVICVGDQATDIVAGWLSGVVFDVLDDRGGFPKREHGPYSYIYPFSFHSKREIAAYVMAKTGVTFDNDAFDPWAFNRPSRHYFYYIAELLQSYFPGFVHWLADSYGSDPGSVGEAVACENCGKRYYAERSDRALCGLCEVFMENGFLSDYS